MEHREGKRVQKDEKKSGGAKIAGIAILIVVIALVGAYLGVCAYANGSGKFLPNTTISGVEVGGMTPAEAVAQLDARVEETTRSGGVEFTCSGNVYTVPLSDFTVNTNDIAQETLAAQRGSFFTLGARFIAALIGGQNFQVNTKLEGTPAAVEQAVRECTDAEAQTTWTHEPDAIVFRKGVTGRTLDVKTLEDALEERAGHLLFNDEPAAYVPIEVEVTTAPPMEPDFEEIHQSVYTEAADAYLDGETKEIVPSVTGVDFNVEAARAQLANTAEGDTCRVALKLSEPELTTEKLETLLFADVLGYSVTNCAGPSNRWYNIDLACSRVNGTILLPGEEFSYNALAGPYTTDGGYRKADAYVGGKSVDTTAGGICQLSSTIYWTTLKANLEIVERSQHKYNSGYMPVVGTDATVYSDTLDFRFKNDTEYPVKIECYQDDSHRLHVTIYGTDTTGIHGEPYSVVLSTVPYKTIYVADASKVPVGGEPVRDDDWARYNGITVEVYQKLVDENGRTVDTIYLYKNTYSVSNPRYWYNPADAERLGIDPATGLQTLTPVTTPTPTPTTSETPTPSVDPLPTPSVEPTPGVEPTPSVEPPPTPSEEPTPTTEPTSAPEPTFDEGLVPTPEVTLPTDMFQGGAA